MYLYSIHEGSRIPLEHYGQRSLELLTRTAKTIEARDNIFAPLRIDILIVI